VRDWNRTCLSHFPPLLIWVIFPNAPRCPSNALLGTGPGSNTLLVVTALKSHESPATHLRVKYFMHHPCSLAGAFLASLAALVKANSPISLRAINLMAPLPFPLHHEHLLLPGSLRFVFSFSAAAASSRTFSMRQVDGIRLFSSPPFKWPFL